MRTDLVWDLPSGEGRTKDGNDATHKGKYEMAHPCRRRGPDQFSYFEKDFKVVPNFQFPYEYDHTDDLKMPLKLPGKIKGMKKIREKLKIEDFQKPFSEV